MQKYYANKTALKIKDMDTAFSFWPFLEAISVSSLIAWRFLYMSTTPSVDTWPNKTTSEEIKVDDPRHSEYLEHVRQELVKVQRVVDALQALKATAKTPAECQINNALVLMFKKFMTPVGMMLGMIESIHGECLDTERGKQAKTKEEYHADLYSLVMTVKAQLATL
jgi:hypothetical protein